MLIYLYKVLFSNINYSFLKKKFVKADGITNYGRKTIKAVDYHKKR